MPGTLPPSSSAMPNVLSDAVYAAIGRVAVLWGHLEQAIGIGIAGLLEAQANRFFAVSANLSAANQLDTFLSLGNSLLNESGADHLRQIVGRARGLSGERTASRRAHTEPRG